MTDQTTVTAAEDSGLKADFIFGGVLLAVFAIALVLTFDWPAGSAMFPRVVTGTGLVMSVAFLITLLVRWRREKSPDYVERRQLSAEERALDHVRHDPLSADAAAVDAAEPADPDQPEDVEYVFATAGRSAWLQALGWVAVFLVLMLALGLFAASGIFAFLYLRWGARRTWLFSIIYAVVLPVLLLALFRVLLYVPTPVGILTGW